MTKPKHHYKVSMLDGRVIYRVFNSYDHLLKTRTLLSVNLPFWTYMFCTIDAPETQEKVLELAHKLAKEDCRQLDKYMKD